MGAVSDNRIYLKDNPWPNGHALKEVKFFGQLKEDGIYLHLYIASEDYYAEDGDDDDFYDKVEAHDEKLEEEGIEDDWRYYSGWLNYHSCHIEPNIEQLLGNKENPFSMTKLSGLELKLDDPPPIDEEYEAVDFDNMAFHCYVLGHDAVAHHHIKISPSSGSRFEVNWTGKVAMTYMGDEEFKHDFEVQLKDIPFEGFDGGVRNELRQKNEEESYWYDLRDDRTIEEREEELRNWIGANSAINQDELVFEAGKRSDWLKFK